MLYLLIILRTGLSGILWTAGFFMSVYLLVTSSLYTPLVYSLRYAYESIIWDDLLGVGAWHSSNGSKWLWQACRSKAVNVLLFFSDLYISIISQILTYNSEFGFGLIELFFDESIFVPVGYRNH